MVRTRTSMATPPTAKALRALVAAVVAVALLGLPAIAAAHDGFGDVADGGTHSANIHTLDHDGIFAGTLCGDDGDLFCPGEPLTRAHMAVWLVRVLDGSDPAEVTGTRFSDVDGGHPHAAFIERFAALGVTFGCATGPLRYCPDDNVTRAQMAAFLVRAFEVPAAEAAGFVDVDTGSVHSGDIDALAATRITFGCASGPLRYCPGDDVTRAQMASFLMRAKEYAASVVWTVSSPLEQCASDVGWYGAGRVSVLAGTTAAGYYEPVVQGGVDSCERIKAWWGEITAAEAERMWQGQYPCEYATADADWESYPDANGPPLLAGCWPRLLEGGNEKHLRAEGHDDAYIEGHYILPPNEPPLVTALYGCYRDGLSGPPPGWASPDGGEWMTVNFCTRLLKSLGNPVRYLGVTAECAAEQYAGLVAEHKTRGDVASHGGYQYAGDYSWANCETHADRLLPAELRTASFRQRCEAVIDAAARTDEDAADAAAEGYGLSRADHIIEKKAMYCAGTAENLEQYPQFYGAWVVSWLPQEGSVCWEAALLHAARTAVYGQATKVKIC